MPSAAIADRTGLLLPQSNASAALVVGGVFAIIAMVLALFWRSKASLPAQPARTERQLKQDVAIITERVPVVWNADFLLGLKDATREDSCARCEINARPIHRISDKAHEALTTTTPHRLASRLRRS